MKSPSIRKPPSKRSVNGMSRTDWNLQLLLFRHKLLLPQPLHHHDLCLDLQCQDSEQVLLDCQWWGQSERPYCRTALFVTMQEASSMADGGIFCSSCHHASRLRDPFLDDCLPGVLICYHQIILHLKFDNAWKSPGFLIWDEMLFPGSFRQRSTKTVP